MDNGTEQYWDDAEMGDFIRKSEIENKLLTSEDESL